MASSLGGTLPYETDSLYEDLEFVVPYGEYPGLEEEEKYESSYFEYVEFAPYDEVLALNEAYDMDPDPDKINLSFETYKTDEGKPWILPVVREIEQIMAGDVGLNHEYLPTLGLKSFCDAAVSLLLEPENSAINDQRAFGVQTLSEAGAFRIGAEFLNRVLNFDICYVSNPTCENHHLQFLGAGFSAVMEYRYWDSVNYCLDFEGMLEDLRKVPSNAVVVFHACAHNPTGVDPTMEQWRLIADVCEERKFFIFFDIGYQGFATGDINRDAWTVRMFATRGFEMFIAQSFGKSFGLYNERIGNLCIVAANKGVVAQLKSQFTLLVRGMYSCPPNHGERIVTTILNDRILTEKWQASLKIMATRLNDMRILLKSNLKIMNTPGSWDHMKAHLGLFSYTGLTKMQVENMVENHHIYMPSNGRINISGINLSNVKLVAEAIHDSVLTFPATDEDE